MLLAQPPRSPRAGRDYPGSARAFYSWFNSEDACLEWLEKVRWRPVFKCPACGSDGAIQVEPGLRRCLSCRRRVSVLSGTPFHRHRVTAQQILEIGWALTTRPGLSAMQLSNGPTAQLNYENAWTLLHKYREVIHSLMLEIELSGNVEADEAYVGGHHAGIRGRGALGKHCVLILVEKRRGGRVGMARVPSASAASLLPQVQRVAPPPATIHTDANPAYNGLARLGYRHRSYSISALPGPAHAYLPAIHSVASGLKRWMLGTLRRTPDARHLDYYLAEFAYRFNHRRARNKGLLFYRLIEVALEHEEVAQRAITGR